jgi:hypothetical protein
MNPTTAETEELWWRKYSLPMLQYHFESLDLDGKKKLREEFHIFLMNSIIENKKNLKTNKE